MSRTPTTRDRLIAATLAELDAHGFAHLRVDDIARRAELTTGAIYGAFPSKQALIVAALTHRDEPALQAALTRPVARTLRRVLEVARDRSDERGAAALRLADVASASGMDVARLRARFDSPWGLFVAAVVATDHEGFVAAARSLRKKDDALDPELTTREQLIESTLEALDDVGHRSIRVADIARRAGLTTGAVYANFGSKQNLVDAAMAHRYASLFRIAMDQNADDHRGGGVMNAVARALVSDATVDHAAVIELFGLAARDKGTRDPIVSQLSRRHLQIAELVERGKAAGTMFDDLSSDGIAHVVQLLALGNLVAQALHLPSPTDDDLLATLDRLSEGIRAEPPSR